MASLAFGQFRMRVCHVARCLLSSFVGVERNRGPIQMKRVSRTRSTPVRPLFSTVSRALLTFFNERPLTPLAVWEVPIMCIAKRMQGFITSEDGPTAVEYAVMLALIIVVCLVAIGSLGTNAKTTFTNIANSMGSAS